MTLAHLAASPDLPVESDRFKDFPHPREMLSLIGHREAEQEVLDALKAGRMHHAWLIAGEEGVGKATFAYRIARFLLAHPGVRDFRGFEDFSVGMDHPVAHQIAAGGHPDLAVIRRGLNQSGKGLSLEIRASDVRGALDVFNKTAAAGGYRIAIVDCCDELNAQSANALLKTLEEPPADSLFLLVAHRPGALLPTIRSRCRMLKLRPLDLDDVAYGLSEMPGGGPANEAMRAAAARESGGSLRRALAMLDAPTLEFLGRVRAALNGLPRLDAASVDAIAEGMTGKRGEDAFERFCDLVEIWLAERLHDPACRADPVRLAAEYAATVERRREVEIYNLDRRPFVLTTMAALAAAL